MIEIEGRRMEVFPSGARALERVQPIWRSFPGWRSQTTQARRWQDLPGPALEYLEWIERECGVPIASVSVGAGREAEVPRG